MLFASGILRFRTSADILVIGPRAAFGLGHHLSGLISEDDVRRRLTQSLVDPASRDAIRRFWGHWQSDSIRITIVSDQDLIDRIAMMTVRGPLAAHVTLDISARHMPSVSGKKSSEPLAARRQGAVTRGSSSSPPANAVVARPPAVANRPVTGPSAVRPSGLVAPATPGTGSAGAAQQTEVKKPVSDMTVPERLTEVLNLTGQYLGPDLREQFIAALEGAAFFVILDVLGLWAALHAVGAGFVLDAFIAIGLFLAGRAAIEAGASLIRCLEIVYSAKSEDDLNEAAKLVANVVALIGVAIFIAIVTHGLNRAEAPPNKSEGLRRAPEEPRPPPPQRIQERPKVVSETTTKPEYAPPGLAFRKDLPKHLAGPDGFKGNKLHGTHNLENAKSALEEKGINYSLEQTSTPGISELKYRAVNKYGEYESYSKTVYDPKVYSDARMVEMAQSVGERAFNLHGQDPSQNIFDLSENGVNFRAYINLDPNTGVPYVGNVHPVK